VSDERALFAAICANPEEDTPRLMYADWLQEHGDEHTRARAEFIRAQIESYYLPPEDDDREAVERRFNLDQRETELQRDGKGYRRPWAAWGQSPPQGTPEGVTFLSGHPDWFVRGFHGFAMSTAERFVAVGASLFGMHPVHGLFDEPRGAVGKPEAIAKLLTLPWLTRIKRMELNFDGPFTEPVFGCERLANLERLTFRRGELGPVGSPIVGSRGALSRLQSLTVSASVIWPSLMGRLLELLPGDCLTELNLNPTEGDTAGALRWLATSGRFPNLTRLRVTKRHNDPVFAPALQATVQAPFWQRLRTFGLKWGVTDTDAELLAAAPSAPIHDLDLSHSSLTPAGLATLAASPLLRSVTKLSLRWGRFGNAGMVALAKSPNLANLSVLDLENCDLGSKGIKALVGAPWVDGLVTLNLRQNSIKKAGAEALIAARFPHLRSLSMFQCVRTGELQKQLANRFGPVVNLSA
jgi:uncharacterized protein (TIGR02996 family)